MGQLKHDGRATQGGKVAPAGQAITFGDLYRIDGWTGFALSTIGANDTVRSLELEIATDRVWYIKLPAGLNPAIGDMLYWSAGAGFKSGDTDLVASGTAGAIGPAAKVEEVKDSNGYAAVRAIQGAPS